MEFLVQKALEMTKMMKNKKFIVKNHKREVMLFDNKLSLTAFLIQFQIQEFIPLILYF